MRGRETPNVLGGLLGWVWLVITILPIYYMVVTSLRPRSSYYADNPLSIPTNPTIKAYQDVLAADFGKYFYNSVFVTVITVAAVVFMSLLAAYVIVRNRSALTRRMFDLLLLGIAIPLQGVIIPVYYRLFAVDGVVGGGRLVRG